jgi:hypothetical protein
VVSKTLQRARGILGLAAFGGAAGALFGAAWEAVSSVRAVGTIWVGGVTLNAVIWGTFGALSAGGFGVLLPTLSAGRKLDGVATWRAGLLGAAAGAVVPVVALALLNGALPAVLERLPLLGFCAGLGGLIGSGLIAIAKRAPAEGKDFG